MNIYEAVRKATMSLQDQMEAEGVVPAEDSNPRFVYDKRGNTFTLTIIAVPRGECEHTAGLQPIAVLDDDKVVMVMHCPICKKVMS